MLELMLNISDYQPWLKSMLALAERREVWAFGFSKNMVSKFQVGFVRMEEG